MSTQRSTLIGARSHAGIVRGRQRRHWQQQSHELRARSKRSWSPASAAACANRSRPSAKRSASSTRSMPRTSASSPTRISPRRCSACPASSSAATSAKASASTCAALSSTLTRTLLNGHALATADWFILDQLNTTRSFNYLMLPADVIGQVKVFKSPQADFEEGGIGGTIDVVTRKPLDLESMQTFLSGQMALHGSRGRIRSAVLGPVQLEERRRARFGVMVAAIYQKRNIRRDGVEVLGYDTRTVGGQTGAGARPDRLRAVHAGARAQGRQLRLAVRSRRTTSTSTSRACTPSSMPTTPTRTSSPGARAPSTTAAR